MKMMKERKDMETVLPCRQDQNGSVILIVTIVLALLTIIGISLTNMSGFEQKIAGNDKSNKIVFYHSESGNYGMAKWVTRLLDEDDVPPKQKTIDGVITDIHRFELASGQTTVDLKDEAYGYDGAYDAAGDLTYTMTSGYRDPVDGTPRTVTSNVGVNLDRRKAEPVVGGGAEFGTGASGIGEKAAVAIPYWFTTEAVGTGGARASIMSRYVKLLGVPGGL